MTFHQIQSRPHPGHKISHIRLPVPEPAPSRHGCRTDASLSVLGLVRHPTPRSCSAGRWTATEGDLLATVGDHTLALFDSPGDRLRRGRARWRAPPQSAGRPQGTLEMEHKPAGYWRKYFHNLQLCAA